MNQVFFEYEIAIVMRRLHGNPPIWTDFHYHDFQIKLYLKSPCGTGDLYGVDMIEVEELLKGWAVQLPETINDHPDCQHGTTEELCHFFSRTPMLDAQIKILAVSVSECPERITILRLTEENNHDY